MLTVWDTSSPCWEPVGYVTANSASWWICPGVGGGREGRRVCIAQEFKSVFFFSLPTLQELGFTSFIRTLREGDLKRLEKRREEL